MFFETLSYRPVELKFGTSGLRGLVIDMTDLECYINTIGFIRFCKENYQDIQTMYIAGDLRDSTPRIMNAVMRAVADEGIKPVSLGLMPTPVLALRGFTDKVASIMVTGSHIPADRNGIKYYKPDKELMKYDEARLTEIISEVRKEVYEDGADSFDTEGRLLSPLKAEKTDLKAVELYIEHLSPLLKDKPLIGTKVAFYQHSAVGRDLLPYILELAGAEVDVFGRSDTFIPVDTENVTRDVKSLVDQYLSAHPGVDAVMSADGDSDRPLCFDGRGRVCTGDILGYLTSQLLGIQACAYPVSSSDVLDANFLQNNIQFTRTKIGSPYVIDAVDKFAPNLPSAGWEVNGGYMVGKNVSYNGGAISELMTRDAALPLLSTLVLARQSGMSLAELIDSITPKRYAQSGLVDLPSFDACCAVVEKLQSGSSVVERFFSPELGFDSVQNIDVTDGVRICFDNGDIAHVRGSGNAPQLRIYSLSNAVERADEIVTLCIRPGGLFEQISKE